MKTIVTMVGFEKNNIIAFYRRVKRFRYSQNPVEDWTQMQAIPVRQYWYETFYKIVPEIVNSCKHDINIYEEL